MTPTSLNGSLQHNWRDPVGMAVVVQAMSHVSNGYWKAVGPREGRVGLP